jgi:hypothetical protein
MLQWLDEDHVAPVTNWTTRRLSCSVWDWTISVNEMRLLHRKPLAGRKLKKSKRNAASMAGTGLVSIPACLAVQPIADSARGMLPSSPGHTGDDSLNSSQPDPRFSAQGPRVVALDLSESMLGKVGLGGSAVTIRIAEEPDDALLLMLDSRTSMHCQHWHSSSCISARAAPLCRSNPVMSLRTVWCLTLYKSHKPRLIALGARPRSSA